MRWVWLIIGLIAAGVWVGVLVHLVGFELGYWSRPELDSFMLLFACWFGILSSLRCAISGWAK